MRILISGGCKMGKSTLAQQLATAQGGPLYYVATMRATDAEDRVRIARHRREREGWGFETIECMGSIGQLADGLPGDASLLLDSTTALLAGEMFRPDGTVDMEADARVREGLLRLLRTFDALVVVSDTIYADAAAYDALTEAYRKGLAGIDRALARDCDAVIEMAFGQPILHKGDEQLAAWLDKRDSGAAYGDGAIHGPAGVRPLG